MNDTLPAPRANAVGCIHRPIDLGSAIVTTDVCALSRIFEPTVNIIVLERALGEALASATAAFALAPGREHKLAIVPNESGRDALHGQIESDVLVDDIVFWSGVISALADAELVGVRLARHDRAMCPRFHVDRVVLRLCLTYVGAGTEYVADSHVDRRFLGTGAGGRPDETSGLLRDGAVISRAPVGAPVLLKGEAWPDNAGHGAVHRSPAASVDAPRLVLTLDALG